MGVDSRLELALLRINIFFEDAEDRKVHNTAIAFTFIPIPIPIPFPIRRAMRRLRRSSDTSASYLVGY